MHIERYGSGPGIYWGLHGWSGDHTTFAPLAERLPASATLYSVDLPGYGRSPAPRRWDLTAITDEVVSAVRSVEATEVTLVGNCSGAILGLLAAERLQGQLGRLVLIDPFAYVPWYFRLFVETSFGRYAYYSAFANPIGRWLTNWSLRGHRQPETDLTESFASINHEVSYQYLALLARVEGIVQFSGLGLPIDIAYGERTFGAVKDSVLRWQSIWPHARCWELAGAGHLPIKEATGQLSRIIFEGPGMKAQLAVESHPWSLTKG